MTVQSVKKVLITGALSPSAIETLTSHHGLQVNYLPDCSREELYREISDTEIIITRSETTIDQELIDRAPKLRAIARAAVGIANIDVAYATEKGILVFNCPGKNTNSAAELTFGLLLTIMRKIHAANAKVKGGGWDRHTFTGKELRGKRIGIVGLGNVGHRVAKFAAGFDMQVLAYDPYIAPKVFDRYNAVQVTSLRELAEQVDVLSVHVPLNRETKGMVDLEILRAMPKGSYVVNAARGGVIEENALAQALESGHIAGAGIDTWDNEPNPNPILRDRPDVASTPHIGASTYEAQEAIGESIARQVISAADGGVVDHPVNLPQVGVIDDPLVRAYAVLAEKLGSIAGQLLTFNPSQVTISYRGDLAKIDPSLVRLSWMKGYASHVVDEYVSFVNVEAHIKQMGIDIAEEEDPTFQSYKSALKIHVQGRAGERLTIGGTVFDSEHVRFTLVNDFYFEVDLEGHLLMVENHDRPGVIGDVGHFLATAGINIDSFHLSRNTKGGKAMAVIRVDSPLSDDKITNFQGIPNIIRVSRVSI